MNEAAPEWDPVSVSFPQARVKKVMKMDQDVGSIQQDALLRMTCSAEVFLELLTEEASKISDKDKRKTVTYKDVATTVANDARFAFLWEVMPKPMPLPEALELQKRRKAELGETAADIVDMEEVEDEDGGGSSRARASPSPADATRASRSSSNQMSMEVEESLTVSGNHGENDEEAMMIE